MEGGGDLVLDIDPDPDPPPAPSSSSYSITTIYYSSCPASNRIAWCTIVAKQEFQSSQSCSPLPPRILKKHPYLNHHLAPQELSDPSPAEYAFLCADDSLRDKGAETDGANEEFWIGIPVG